MASHKAVPLTLSIHCDIVARALDSSESMRASCVQHELKLLVHVVLKLQLAQCGFTLNVDGSVCDDSPWRSSSDR